MPYRSEAQRRAFHALLNRGEISASTVKEFDEASKGKDLPERISPPKHRKPEKDEPIKMRNHKR